MQLISAFTCLSVALVKVTHAAPLLSQGTLLPCTFPGALFGDDTQKNGVPSGNIQDCAGQCQAGQCIGYSFRNPKAGETQGACFLKTSVSDYNAALGAFASGFTNQGCNGECIVEDMAYQNEGTPSTTLKLTPDASPVVCQLLCLESDTKCVFWNYWKDTQECELLSGATSFTKGENQSYQGMVMSGTGTCWDTCFAQGVHGAGKPLKVLPMPDKSTLACQEACQANEACALFTLTPTKIDGSQLTVYQCNLFDATAELELEVTGMGMSVTGPKMCTSKNPDKPSALFSAITMPSLELLVATVEVGVPTPAPTTAKAPTPQPAPLAFSPTEDMPSPSQAPEPALALEPTSEVEGAEESLVDEQIKEEEVAAEEVLKESKNVKNQNTKNSQQQLDQAKEAENGVAKGIVGTFAAVLLGSVVVLF